VVNYLTQDEGRSIELHKARRKVGIFERVASIEHHSQDNLLRL
jgi:hypothetical protein